MNRLPKLSQAVSMSPMLSGRPVLVLLCQVTPPSRLYLLNSVRVSDANRFRGLVGLMAMVLSPAFPSLLMLTLGPTVAQVPVVGGMANSHRPRPCVPAAR